MISTHARTLTLVLAAAATLLGLCDFSGNPPSDGSEQVSREALPSSQRQAPGGTEAVPVAARKGVEPAKAGIGRWDQYRGDFTNSGFSHSRVPDWSKVGIKWRYWTGSYQSATPAIADGKVIVCTEDGDMHCIDAKTGKGLWKAWVSTARGAGKGVVRSSPMILDGVAYTGNRIGQLWAVDMETGDRKWHWQAKTIKPEIYASPKGDARGIIVCVVDMKLSKGAVVCLDPKTGKEKWKVKTGREVGATPAIFGNNIYVACKDRKIYEIEYATGKVLRQLPLPGTTHCTISIGMGFAFLVTGGQHVLAIDLLGGKTAWDVTESADEQTSLGFGNGRTLVPIGRSMYCFDAVSGIKKWEYEGPHKFAPPCIASNGDVLTINRDGRFRVIREGKLIKEVDLAEPCVAGPVLVDGVVYTCSDVNSGHHVFAIAELE